jgi:hypothetical protein
MAFIVSGFRNAAKELRFAEHISVTSSSTAPAICMGDDWDYDGAEEHYGSGGYEQ